MKITSLLLWVQDNTLSVKFYKKAGFSVEHSDDEYSVVSLSGFDIQLVTLRDEAEFACDSMAGAKGKGVYVYIAVADVDAKYRELERSAIVPATRPRNWGWGNREFIVKDPDGYKFCFWQKITASPSVQAVGR